jgi:circadian clock protein KaiC
MDETAIAGHHVERAATGISGLDDILGGGFPRDHLYLIEGDSGAGKTTLGLQFLLEGRRNGEQTVWVTLSETERDLRETAFSHGWSLDGIEICNLATSEENLGGESEYSFFSPADIELRDVTQAVLQMIERVQPRRVVFDPFSDIRLLARDPLRYRRQVLALREDLTTRGCTVLLMQDATRGATLDPQAEALVHGFITLEHRAPEYGGQRRRIRVHKLRGVPFRDGYHDFSIITGGLAVFPRLVAGEHREEFAEEQVPSGIEALDALLGGGAERGSSLLALGPAGVGKTALATQYAVAAVQRGERAALFLFDETLRAFRARGEGLGMNVTEHMNSGRMTARHVDAAELSPGEFTYLVRQAVERESARVVVIDSLNGYLSAMPEERFLTTHLHELLTYLSHRSVLTILTLGQHGLVGDGVQSPVDVSYLADTVLVLRYFEAFGAVRRALSVVKKRSGAHEATIRELMLSPQGVQVGKTLAEFEGILSGHPRYTGIEGNLAHEQGSKPGERRG